MLLKGSENRRKVRLSVNLVRRGDAKSSVLEVKVESIAKRIGDGGVDGVKLISQSTPQLRRDIGLSSLLLGPKQQEGLEAKDHRLVATLKPDADGYHRS